MRVYIAGPMRGLPDFNFPAFHAAERVLREIHPEAQIFNPARRDVDTYGDRFRSPDGDLAAIPWFDLADAMRADLDYIVNQATHIVMLPGWERSSGAQHELATARLVGVEVLELPGLPAPDAATQAEVRIVDPRTGGAKGRKPQRFELLPWAALGKVAEVYGFGAAKYEDHNWRRGYAWSLSLGAAFRHLAAFTSGEDLDPESGLPHPAHAAFHMLALLTFIDEHPDLDDRARPPSDDHRTPNTGGTP